MESASQQQVPPPCQCQQQFGGAMPWLVLALAIIVALDRWGRRRKKEKENEKTDGPVAGGAHDGGNT
jgi:hypothetical protein